MSEKSCLFCKIAAGEIPAQKRLDNEWAVAFADLNPQSPFHFLIIPKIHVANIGCLDSKLHAETTLGIFALIRSLLNHPDYAPLLAGGYRLVTNTGVNGGQTVHHLHFHLLGGRPHHWPPG